jgi:hypothetical protein
VSSVELNNNRYAPFHMRDSIQDSNLTELQWLYWVGQTMRPQSPLFNNALSFTLTGPLHVPVFRAAFTDFVAANTSMRTVVQTVDGRPHRQVLPHPPAPMHFCDLSAEPAPQETAAAWQAQRVQRVMDIATALYDTALLKIDDQTYIWFLNQHHLITDATSIFLVFQEVVSLYEARLVDAETAVTPLPDFAQFYEQKQKLRQSSRVEKANRYWREKLAKPLPPLLPPARQHVGADRTFRLTQRLPAPLTEKIDRMAAINQERITPELAQTQLFAAVFIALLHQISGKRDLGFMTTIHNRPTAPLRKTIGALMEVCPVRIQLDPTETWESLWEKVQTELQQILLHYRFSQGILRDVQGFNVMLNIARRPALACNGRPVAQEIIHHHTGNESIALHIHHLADCGGFELYFDFNADQFTEAAGSQLMTLFVQLLEAFFHAPGEQIRQHTTAVNPPAAPDFSPAKQPDYAPPRTHLEGQLQAVWQDVLQVKPIGIHDNFFALGGESWQAMQLLLEVEKISKRHLPFHTMLTGNSIAEMARLIHAVRSEEPTIILQHGRPHISPLFFLSRRRR